VTLILFRVDATSNVHQLDFNKRILILKMRGTKIKIIKFNLAVLLRYYKNLSFFKVGSYNVKLAYRREEANN
jgi:hypothetical protein